MRAGADGCVTKIVPLPQWDKPLYAPQGGPGGELSGIWSSMAASIATLSGGVEARRVSLCMGGQGRLNPQ